MLEGLSGRSYTVPTSGVLPFQIMLPTGVATQADCYDLASTPENQKCIYINIIYMP
jgi:hypothetical protein